MLYHMVRCFSLWCYCQEYYVQLGLSLVFLKSPSKYVVNFHLYTLRDMRLQRRMITFGHPVFICTQEFLLLYSSMANQIHMFHTKHSILLRGYCTPGPYFWRLCVFSQKIKQIWTMYPVHLIRNVPRNSKITVSFQ